MYKCKTTVLGVGFLVFLFFFTYHVISKIRGNEKNTKMNNQAIMLCSLGLFYYSVRFSDWATYIFAYKQSSGWIRSHHTKYTWIRWASITSYLLFHALFTLSYLRTTLKLPRLIEITNVYSEILEKVPERASKQLPLATPSEIAETQKKIQKNKKRLLCQEKCLNGITAILVIAAVALSYPYVYGSPRKVENFV